MVRSDKAGFVDFNLHKKGLKRVLGELETAVIERIWGRESVAVRDIFNELQQERDIAYTTVMTTMDRLWKKGLLSRVRDKNAYLYSPVYSKKRLIQNCINQVLDSILPDITEPSLAHFVSNLEKINPALLSELKKLLSEKGKGDVRH
ncbi:MAG TPA: BlaI/MecI/CopY family transcriptional regulator [Candidatus Brocadiia bacterium]|nr:BlaI/MecI/CopY family transcriptional regulator [Planctomycetota bacterium]MBI4006922.1 BlaI/MecI/CopY family transcriptional regulator [Planctomycetota bacterium]MDO8092013.1 BlaI/MecI/CopY family transcriptional regulator [Candidatus Brocadiales bacterium]